LIEPSGLARLPFEFRWSSPVAASTYRLRVFDAGNRLIYTEASRNEHLPVTADLRARLVPGVDYTWTVEALDAADAKTVGSSPERFTVAR
jgi:hypothetical protein